MTAIAEITVGDSVLVRKYGQWYDGKVTRVGRKLVDVEFTTRGRSYGKRVTKVTTVDPTHDVKIPFLGFKRA